MNRIMLEKEIQLKACPYGDISDMLEISINGVPEKYIIADVEIFERGDKYFWGVCAMQVVSEGDCA